MALTVSADGVTLAEAPQEAAEASPAASAPKLGRGNSRPRSPGKTKLAKVKKVCLVCCKLLQAACAYAA